MYAFSGPETRVKNRSQRCLPDNPSGKRTPLPAIFPGMARRMDTIPVSSIWTLNCTLCVFKGDKAISAISTTAGVPPNYIFG